MWAATMNKMRGCTRLLTLVFGLLLSVSVADVRAQTADPQGNTDAQAVLAYLRSLPGREEGGRLVSGQFLGHPGSVSDDGPVPVQRGYERYVEALA